MKAWRGLGFLGFVFGGFRVDIVVGCFRVAGVLLGLFGGFGYLRLLG